MGHDVKEHLHRYLKVGHDALLWKLEGVSEYDARRPLTATGTNLLGLVKHVGIIELGYFTEVFGRSHDIPQPWYGPGAQPNADMWATAEESRAQVVELYDRAWQHVDATVAELDGDAPGTVPWWGERGSVTLLQILVHVATEVHRHAGHADILREQIDGAAGMRPEALNLPDTDQDWWAGYRENLEQVARQFRTEPDGPEIDARE